MILSIISWTKANLGDHFKDALLQLLWHVATKLFLKEEDETKLLSVSWGKACSYAWRFWLISMLSSLFNLYCSEICFCVPILILLHQYLSNLCRTSWNFQIRSIFLPACHCWTWRWRPAIYLHHGLHWCKVGFSVSVHVVFLNVISLFFACDYCVLWY